MQNRIVILQDGKLKHDILDKTSLASHELYDLMYKERLMTDFSAFLQLLPETVLQSLIMSYVAMGIMIPFRMLDRPDISCEGSFTLGSVVYAVYM